MSMNVKSPSPPFVFFVKKCNPPPASNKFYSDPPLPPDKHGLWLDCATIPWSKFTQMHLLARIMQPPIANFLPQQFTLAPLGNSSSSSLSLSFESFSSELLAYPNSRSSSSLLSESLLTLTLSSDWVSESSVAAISEALNVKIL